MPHHSLPAPAVTRASPLTPRSGSNPRLTSAELRDCLQGKRLIRASQLEGHVRADGIAGDWVTIGVIARKADPRTSQKVRPRLRDGE